MRLIMDYEIVRFHQAGDMWFGHQQVIKRGLTLEQAQAHCQSPATSSSTCSAEKLRKVRAPGAWFDGYQEQK
jgi:hypothetical protein